MKRTIILGFSLALSVMSSGAVHAACENGSYWNPNPSVYNTYTGQTTSYNSCQFADSTALYSLARQLGAVPEYITYNGGPFQMNQPMGTLRFSNGTVVNAGLVLQLYANNPKAYADAVLASNIGQSVSMPGTAAATYAALGSGSSVPAMNPACDTALMEQFRYNPQNCNSHSEFRYDYDNRVCTCR